MAQLAADGYSSLNFPVNLNRVTLCGGDIIYLLDEELALLEGNYIADQVITIGSSFQTFTIRSNAAATGGGNSGETHLDIPDLFGMELHYYDPNTPLQAPAQYNGNIAWTKWQVRGREAQYYGYRYDELDRLKRATFGEDWRDQGMLVTNKYTVDSHISDNLGPTIQYDKRGNIEHLRRRGGVGGCSSELGYSWDTVDQLDYSYNGQNQLTSLTDANELAGGIRYNYSEMEYDQNGNLTKDSGKNISQIDYNYLNLPDKITFNSGDQENTIEWTYDAKGNKLVKRVNGSIVKEYLPSGVEYDGDKIEAIYHAEGRAIPMYNPVITGLIDSFRYEYVLQDHLGNGRVYFSDLNEDSKIQVGGIDNEVMQENHYYPFGLNQEGPFYPQQPVVNGYQYNGKELNEEFGLGWNDFGFRYYDPAIGRFTGVDPISDQFPHVSTYNYAENEPIANIDLHGLQKVSIHLVGQLLLDGNSFTTAGTATLDIGNNNSVNYSVALEGLGAVSGSYSKENGFQSSSGASFDLNELAFEVDRLRGIVLPDWAVKMGLNKAKDAFTPENIEEALSLSEDDARFNESMRFLLNSISGLVDQDMLTGLYDYDGTKGTATNEDGESYGRKFTHVYKGKFEDFEFGDDGIKFKGKVVISYTDQKCTSNCDDEK